MISKTVSTSLMAAILLVGICDRAFGQANCALRNPDRQIYAIFPEATSYRTVEAQVNTQNRHALEKEIGSPLSPSDLGTHSAYVVLNGKVPIGFVHARSEIGSRGSIELVWALDVDLTIADFRVQRSRERQTTEIQSEAFRSGLVGRNLTELRALLSSGNDELDLSSLQVAANSAEIAHAVVLCALKTRVITEHCFGDSIVPAQMLGHAHRNFANISKVTEVKTPFADDVLESIQQHLGRDPDQLDLSTIDIVRVRSADSGQSGFMIRTDWKAHPENPSCWLAILDDGTLKHATIAGRSYSTVQQELQGLKGMSLDAIEDDQTLSTPSVQLLAREVLAIASAINALRPASP